MKARKPGEHAIPLQPGGTMWEKTGANTQSTEEQTDVSLHIYRTCVEMVFLTLCQLSNSAPEGRRLFSASVLQLLIDTNAERVALCHT